MPKDESGGQEGGQIPAFHIHASNNDSDANLWPQDAAGRAALVRNAVMEYRARHCPVKQPCIIYSDSDWPSSSGMPQQILGLSKQCCRINYGKSSECITFVCLVQLFKASLSFPCLVSPLSNNAALAGCHCRMTAYIKAVNFVNGSCFCSQRQSILYMSLSDFAPTHSYRLCRYAYLSSFIIEILIS